MIDLVLTEEQARLAEQEAEALRLRTRGGRVIGVFRRAAIPDELLAEAERLLNSAAHRVPPARRPDHLLALRHEWDHRGGFDRAYMVAFLSRLRDEEERLGITPEFVEELKRRAAAGHGGPCYTGAQVQARLHALQEEWDRTGGFDEAHMRALLRKRDETDPPHARSGAPSR
ncbi:MAG TPA: hypothetical protein VIL46_07465 [Gemmataceae bacterium]